MTDRELAGCALLPCPFCGGTSLTVYADGVWCEQCPAHHDVDPPSEAEAIAAWNRRTPSSEGDGRDAERYRRWRLLAASGTMSEAVCEMMIDARTEDDIDAVIDAASQQEGK